MNYHMKPNFRIYFFFIFLITFKYSFAQIDPHFSQFYSFPSFLNPALTGMHSGKVRLTSIYRSQWANLGNPFITKGFSVDGTSNSNLSIGASFFNINSKNSGYNYNNGNLNFAYNGIRFGKDGYNIISAGIQIGFLNSMFNLDQLTFGDQWDLNTGFNRNNVTQEILTNTNTLDLDIGAGLIYFNSNPNVSVNPFLGVSVFHLNKPKIGLLSIENDRLPIRKMLHGGMRIKINDELTITPNVLTMFQGSVSEIIAGAYSELFIGNQSRLLFGVNHRMKDATSGYLGLTFSNYSFGFSYDMNSKALTSFSNRNGSFEISLSVLFNKKESINNIDFICPRL